MNMEGWIVDNLTLKRIFYCRYRGFIGINCWNMFLILILYIYKYIFYRLEYWGIVD